MRASIVTRSMPTRETRTHASMTMPLSRTRSRTSISELPLGERSTAISCLLLSFCRGGVCGRWDGGGLRVRAQSRICPPPVHSDLLRLVDGADEKADLNREELDVREIDLDVANHDEALVEHAIEDVDETIGARRGY